MAVDKEEKANTWRALYRYTNWNDERKQTKKRGFKIQREALEQKQEFQMEADVNIDL